MKYLIIFFITFSCFANFDPIPENCCKCKSKPKYKCYIYYYIKEKGKYKFREITVPCSDLEKDMTIISIGRHEVKETNNELHKARN